MALVERLVRSCRQYGDEAAIIDPGGPTSYAGLLEQVMGMAGLLAAGAPEPHIGLLLPTSRVFPISFFGALAAGKTPVPLNYLLAPAEMAAVVRDAGVKTIVTSRVFGNAAEQLGCRPIVVEDLAGAGPPPRCEMPDEDDDALAVLLYTSGTTGHPKGVELTHRNLLSCADASLEHMKLDRHHVMLGMLPLFHAFGLTATMVLPLIHGMRAVYIPKFSPPAVLQAIAEHGVTVAIAVASMYGALARAKSTGDAHDLSSLRLCVSGGEPLPKAVAAGFRAALGLDLLEGYGLTESSPIAAINPEFANRPGAAGLPIPGVRFEIVDSNGSAVATGEHGEIVIHGPIVMRGYHQRPEDTAAVIGPDGGLHTGDLGYLDDDGYLWISGRQKELIICGGSNVYPREVEETLTAHPDVAEAAVIGVPDASRGEAPKAYVVLRAGADVSPLTLREWCRERLAGYKVPREVVVRPELPHAPSGKVLKSKLT